MKRKHKLSLPLALLATLIALLLALACGGGSDGAVIVSLTPSTLDAAPGETIKVDVEVDPKGRGISAAEVTINFDPQALAYDGMSVGGLLGESPLLGVESGERGQLLFALARRGPTSAPTEAGTLATITFKVLEGPPSGEYGLTVYRVGLADEAQQDVALIASSSATVNL